MVFTREQKKLRKQLRRIKRLKQLYSTNFKQIQYQHQHITPTQLLILKYNMSRVRVANYSIKCMYLYKFMFYIVID